MTAILPTTSLYPWQFQDYQGTLNTFLLEHQVSSFRKRFQSSNLSTNLFTYTNGINFWRTHLLNIKYILFRRPISPFSSACQLLVTKALNIFTFNMHSDIHYPIHIPLYQSLEKHCQGFLRVLFIRENSFRHEKLPALEFSTICNFLNCKLNLMGQYQLFFQQINIY